MMLRIMGNDIRTAYDGQEAVAGGGGVPARRGAAGHRPAEAERLRGVPPHPGAAVGQEHGPHRRDGWGQEEDRRRSHEAGFDHHLVKPVDPHALMKLLAELRP